MPKTGYLATITPEKIIELTNQERARADLKQLIVNPQLEKAAQAKAQAIIQSQKFDHEIDGRKFSSWIKEASYKYSIVGENLAIDFITSEGVLKAWLQSPNHRENIFNNEYREIGLAAIEGEFQGQNTIVIVQIFGAPAEEKINLSENNNSNPERKNTNHKSSVVSWLQKSITPSKLSWAILALRSIEKPIKLVKLDELKTFKFFF